MYITRRMPPPHVSSTATTSITLTAYASTTSIFPTTRSKAVCKTPRNAAPIENSPSEAAVFHCAGSAGAPPWAAHDSELARTDRPCDRPPHLATSGIEQRQRPAVLDSSASWKTHAVSLAKRLAELITIMWLQTLLSLYFGLWFSMVQVLTNTSRTRTDLVLSRHWYRMAGWHANWNGPRTPMVKVPRLTGHARWWRQNSTITCSWLNLKESKNCHWRFKIDHVVF